MPTRNENFVRLLLQWIAAGRTSFMVGDVGRELNVSSAKALEICHEQASHLSSR